MSLIDMGIINETSMIKERKECRIQGRRDESAASMAMSWLQTGAQRRLRARRDVCVASIKGKAEAQTLALFSPYIYTRTNITACTKVIMNSKKIQLICHKYNSLV